MAWPWKKKDSFIDLTTMKKSGLLDRSLAIKNSQVSQEGTSSSLSTYPQPTSTYPSSTPSTPSYQSSSTNSTETSSEDSSAGGFLNFLDNSTSSIASAETSSYHASSSYPSSSQIASAETSSYPSSSQATTLSSTEDTTSYNSRLRMARRAKMAEFSQLKSKVEDIEYKLDRLLERLDKMDGN